MTTTKTILETLFSIIALMSLLCMIQVIILLNEKATVCIGEPSPIIRTIEIIILLFGILYALTKIGLNIKKGIHWIGEKL